MNKFIIGFVLSILFLVVSCSTVDNKSDASDSKFKLDKWELQLPVNSFGLQMGDMSTIEPAKTVEPWFVASKDKLKFVCPIKGATSANTESPRTELKELKDWSLEEGGVLKATLSVDQIPSGGVTIGQVWSQSQPLRLRVKDDGKITAAGGGYDSSETVGTVKFGETFTYRVEVKGEVLDLYINDVKAWTRSMSAWKGKKMYFKAGAYCSASEGTNSDERFKVTFFELKVTH